MSFRLLRFAICASIALAFAQVTAHAQCGGQFQLKQVSCVCGGSVMAFQCNGLGSRCTQMNLQKLCGQCFQFFDTAGCSDNVRRGFDAAKLDQRIDSLQPVFVSNTKNDLAASRCAAGQTNLEAWILSRRRQLSSR